MQDEVLLPGGQLQRPGFVVPGAPETITRSGNVFYCAAPPLGAPHLRQVLEAANVHFYLDAPDVLMAGAGYIAVHATTDGTKTLRLPNRADWCNVRTGTVPLHDSQSYTVTMQAGETLLLQIDRSGA